MKEDKGFSPDGFRLPRPDEFISLEPKEKDSLFWALCEHQRETRKQIEALSIYQQELDAARKKYHALYDWAPFLYLVLDANNVIEDVNLFGARNLGYTRQDLIGRPVSHFVHPEDLDNYSACRQILLDQPLPSDTPLQKAHCELRLKSKTGNFVASRLYFAVLPEASPGEEFILRVCAAELGQVHEPGHTETAMQLPAPGSGTPDAGQAVAETGPPAGAMEDFALRLRTENRGLLLKPGPDPGKSHHELEAVLDYLLYKRDTDKAVLEERISQNIEKMVLPYIRKLRNSGLSDRQVSYLELLENQLTELTASFATTLSTRFPGLTPTEIQVADLVRDGRTSKEIAEITQTSLRAVEFHRSSLRRKFGLKKRNINLRAYLLSLAASQDEPDISL